MFGIARTSELFELMFLSSRPILYHLSCFSRCLFDRSIYDRDRSRCDAEERSLGWMLTYFERRARELDDDKAQSQDSRSSYYGHATTVEVRSSFDKIHLKYTERDEVLQTLLTRAEDNKTATVSAGKKTWVSKWDFNFDKNDKSESTAPVEEATATTSQQKARKSPTKSRQASPAKKSSKYTLPTRKPHLKSIKEKSEDSSASSYTPENVPRKTSPLKTNNKNTEGSIPSNDQIRKPSTVSMTKKRKSPELSDRLKSKVAEEPAKWLSGSKKQNQPAVVDLTFSDGDSD